MIDLFKQEASDDLPEFMDITYAQAVQYWDEWLIYRALGKRNHAGTFEPSITYREAIELMSDDKLNVFLVLDSLYGKMERQYIKQTAGNKEGV